MAYTPAAPPALQSELAYTLEAPPALQSELKSLFMKNAKQQAHLATLIEQLQKSASLLHLYQQKPPQPPTRPSYLPLVV